MTNQNCGSNLATFTSPLGAVWLLLFATGCPIGPITPPAINQAPTSNAGAAQNVGLSERAVLSGQGSTDPDDDPLTYLWVQRSGPSVTIECANCAQARFVSSEEGSYEFALTVTDGRGGSDTSTVRVFARDAAPPRCPHADAGLDQAVNEGNAVTLRGANSADPSGSPLSYEWLRISVEQVSINGVFTPEPSFTAPQVSGPDVELEFDLTVTNEQGCSDTDTVVITVRDREPEDPCNDVVCDDDGQFCNGVESCDGGICLPSGNPCLPGEICNETSDSCDECSEDSECDDQGQRA